ncbi:MAG: glutamine--fructose-6-phosphate transaminase (isomerizing) [Chthonomonadales bacterium]
MCGITGYVGRRSAVDTAIANLKRLEYRGYDSAGVAYPHNGGIRVVKAPGKIVNLEALLQPGSGDAHVAVAHTRWATHGSPNEANAHPHLDCTGTLAVVHNGIVENYAELRERLIAQGHEFRSETDTEVIAHLIEAQLAQRGPSLDAASFASAACAALGQIRGSYAIAVITRTLPELVFVARKDSPLVVGLGEGENFLASDIPALLAFTRRVIVLEDGDCGIVTRHSVQVFGSDGLPRTRPPLHITWDDQAAEKGGFAHFMLKEIHEEPRTVRDTLRGRLDPNRRVVLPDVALKAEDWSKFRRIAIVACGTAYHAGVVGKRLLEQLLGRPVEASVASEFRYSDPLVDAETLTILVSQSGETADTLAALREARRKGSTTLAVVNVVGSTLAREADAVLYTQAGPEIGVASTKAYLAQLTALTLLALYLAQLQGAQDHRQRALVDALEALPDQISQCLERSDEVHALAKALAQHTCFFYLGRGYDYAAAMEAALKLKEISYIHAEAYPAGEMKHGPLALVEPGVAVVGLCTQPQTYEKMLSNLKEVKARQGTVVAVLRDGEEQPDGTDYVVRVPNSADALMPVLAMVPMQLMAYYIALERGCPIDQPRNLAKSVTVE